MTFHEALNAGWLVPAPGSSASAPRSRRTIAPVTKTTPPIRRPPVIAVLPFVNLSGNNGSGSPTVDTLGNGIALEIVRAVRALAGGHAAVRRARLPPSAPDRHFRDIGQRLDVDLLMLGNIREVAGTVRTTVDLFGAAQGDSVWSGCFDCKRGIGFTIRKVATPIAREVNALVRLQEVRAGQRR